MSYKSFIPLVIFILYAAQASADDDWTSYRPNNIGNLITSVVADKDKIWYGSTTGLSCYDKHDHSIKNYTVFDGLIDNAVTDIALDHDGTLWVATNEGVSSFDGGTWSSFTNEEYFNNYIVHDIYVDMNNHKWFPANKGIIRFDNKKWDMFREPYHEKSMRILSAGEDSNGTIWFGSEHRGVALFDGSSWTYYDGFHDLYSQTFVTIKEDKNGTMWLGAFNGTLFSYDGNKWSHQTVVSGSNPRLYDFDTDETGRVWAATNQGLTKIENTVVTVFEQDGTVFNTSTRSISIDESDVVWVGGYKGISEFNGTTFTCPTIIQGPSHKTTTYIAISPDNTKFFGHYYDKGISRFDGKIWTAHIFDYGSVGNGIAVDNEGTVWCTAGGYGALSFDGNRVENYFSLRVMNILLQI